jgi:hypothetical protein
MFSTPPPPHLDATRAHGEALSPGAVMTLDRLARDGIPHEVLWHEGGRSFASTLLAGLRDALRDGGSVPDAVAHGLDAASARGVAPLGQREGWAASALTSAVRALARQTLDGAKTASTGPRDPDIAAVARASATALEATVPSGAREGTANAARRALAELHEAALSSDASTAASALLGHLRIGCVQLRMGASMDAIARGAVTRADRAEHADPHAPWARVDPSLRRTLMRACLAEAAVALARASAREWARAPEVSVGLARCASSLLAACGACHEWLLGENDSRPDDPRPDDRPIDPRPIDPARDAPPVSTVPHPRPPRNLDARTHARSAQEAPMTQTTAGSTTPSTGARASAPLLVTLEHDAQDAAWRLAGSQFVKLMRDPLVGLLSRHLGPGDDAMRARIAGFLETELGAAILSALLSAALSSMPRAAGPIPERLARELRVRAMTDAGDVVADLVMGPLRQVASLYLQDPSFVSAAQGTSGEPPRALGGSVIREDAVATGAHAASSHSVSTPIDAG